MTVTFLIILIILLSVLPKTDPPGCIDDFSGDPYDHNKAIVRNSIDDDFSGDPYDHNKAIVRNSIDDDFSGDPYDH